MSDLQQPMYGGARMNAASSTPAPVQTADVSTKPTQRALQNAQEFVSDVAHQYQRMKDFGEQTRLEGQMDTLATEFEQEMTKRLGFARGHELSFYNGDGTLKESSLNTFVRNYEGKFRGLKGNFVAQEEAARFGARQQDVMRRLQGRAAELLLKGQIQESRQALDAKLKLAEERKDWGSYEDAVMGGLNAGLLAPDQAELMKEKANKINLGQQFDNLAATNPGGAYDLLDSEAYKNQFSPYELDVMRRRLASQARPAIADSFFNSFVLTRKKDKGKSGTKNDGPEWTGFFTKKECEWIRAIEAGKGALVRPQIAAAAAEEARAFNPSLSEEESEVARDAYIQKYSRLGMEKEWLSRQWGDADKMRKELKTPTIDIKGRLDLLEKRGSLLNQFSFNAENQPYSNEEGWASGGKFRDEFMGQLGLTPTDTNKSAMAKYMAYARASHAAGLRSQISERFHSWRENDGKDATLAEQQAKLISLTREITGNRNIAFVDEGVNQMDFNIANAKDAQKTKFFQWAMKSGRKYWVDSTAQEAPMQRVSLGFDSTRKDLPAGILLPKSMMEGFDQKNGVVEATFDNEHFRRFRVVGTCEGDSPQMSYAVAREGLYDAGRSFAVDMRVIKGDTDQLMKQQDTALPAGKAVKINKSALRGLAPYEQAFYDAGNKYGVDPKLLMAISMHETAAGTSSAFRNKKNAMGISPNGGGPRSFDSVEESIDYTARLLKQHYLNQGLTTIESIGGKYAPTGADNDPRNLNQHWAKGVRKYYNSL